LIFIIFWDLNIFFLDLKKKKDLNTCWILKMLDLTINLLDFKKLLGSFENIFFFLILDFPKNFRSFEKFLIFGKF